MESILNKDTIKPIVIILFSIIFYIIFKNVMLKAFMKKAKKSSNKKALTTITVVTNIVKYVLLLAAGLMLLDFWGVDTKGLLTSLGILGIVVGLALQDLIKDVIGGTSILTENQYKVGDNIKIGNFRGDVIYLGLKTTKVRAYTGEVKIFANRNITEVTNYSIRNAKCVIDVPTSYEDDIDKVKEALENVCKILTKEKDYIIGEATLLGVEKLDDSSVNIRIIATTKPMYDFDFKRAALETIIREFKKQKLTIPYPQMEVHCEK